MQFNIRQATANDAESICQLLVEGGELHSQALPMLLRPPDSSTTLEFVKGVLQDSNAHVLLAELSGQIIGLVHFNRIEETEHPVKVARIFISVSSLMVQEEHRQQGVGDALMRKVHEWAEKQCINDIELHVYEFNKPALNFYEKLGYHTTSRRMTRTTTLPTEIREVSFTPDELQEALRPIASLLSKSEKAQQKLEPGTWQHRMLRDNLKALHVASALMSKESGDTKSFTEDDLQETLRAFDSMIGKIEKTQAKFSPGTSQHTLQRNRLRALCVAQALTKAELEKRQLPKELA